MGGSIACAGLFALLLVAAGFHLPTPTFPIVHALTLMVFLGTPRLGYRVYRGRPRRAADEVANQRVMLVGAGDAADAFFRAAATDPAGLRIMGLLALTDRQAGHHRRSTRHPGKACSKEPAAQRARGDRA
jgi:O-antigen biosynthesis protein WbqV